MTYRIEAGTALPAYNIDRSEADACREFRQLVSALRRAGHSVLVALRDNSGFAIAAEWTD
ncbi:conserved protein of unknown function (plasmid) [Rhodovastum atsumiense]|uniref:Uncharacterized protein n=1 Tax=Rhodovastum atsumiense TaxID=504468 RepID=A0A5M6ITV0_9PROT|nr:hypothetical protein [Rhodovastum atsumiense]KAA5611641.1 hypothetical protein F1189_13860 [Rhodovastum atsumiense]CAH2606265.1 conserved protein of unknown function [Rhodovastum atsumiense]